MPKDCYIHGTHDEEQERLRRLNELTNRSFIEFVQCLESDNILELGSGLGILAEQFSLRLNNGRITGIEISEEQIADCPPETERLKFIHGDVHHLPFHPEQFDLIYCRYILEHVMNPVQVLHEAWRVLKPGGKIFIQENSVLLLEFYPDCPQFKAVWKTFANYQLKLGGDPMIGFRLYDLLKRTGFTRIELSMAPEIHYPEKGTLEAWIDNLIHILQGAAGPMTRGGFTDSANLSNAIQELTAFKQNKNASAYFYWNRANATKEEG